MAEANLALSEARLRALARSCCELELDDVDASIGAGLASDDGDVVAFFVAEDNDRAIGPALHWARARSADRLEVLALDHGPDLARRSVLLSHSPPDQPPPDQSPTDKPHTEVRVWNVDGATVTPAEARPRPEVPELGDDVWAWAGVMSEAGARPIDDHGLLVAEVAGLEVARIVDDGLGAGAESLSIEFGVGQADRELNELVHRETDPDAGLRRVIAAVIGFRQPGSHHPLARIARARWLRSMLFDDPGLVGAVDLSPLVPLRPRASITPVEPSAAAGFTVEGEPLVVVAVNGVDLDVVAEAADYRQGWNPDARLVLVMPERDLALNRVLVHRLANASAIAIGLPWELNPAS